MNTIIILLVFIICLVIYFTPTIVAVFRPEAKNKNLILFANLLLGWTFIGWIACLIWALISGSERAGRMARMANTYVPRAVDDFLDSADQTLEKTLPPKDKKEKKQNATTES